VGDFSDFLRGQIFAARLAGTFVNKSATLSGLSRAGYDGIHKSWEDIIS
jgi:hypothetical protein